MPDDGDEPLQHAAPIDTTRCFFLEYDERGFAKQKILPVLVDVMKIKRIPRGNIFFNHRSLSANIVRGIVNAIESSITTEPRPWDRPDLVLAPVDRNDIVGGQGRRITPTEFFEKDSSEFDWYAVCGQHTVEAMKTLVKKGSPAVDIYVLRAYSKVRVVYFGDEQTRGYFNVFAFNNTRENRGMMLSFEDAVRDMRQWWIDNHRIEAPKSKVSDKDAVAVAHQKKWQNFLRVFMGKACDNAFVKQALENEYSKDWSNKLCGYMNLATSTEAVWPLIEKFFEMFNEGKLPVGDGKIPLDMPSRMEGRQPGPYTDETKGQRTLYHCIYARDGPKGSTVWWKDLCPSYFKNFGDLTCREREVALLLLMKGKVVATNFKFMPPRVNTECLLDIMRKERYMVRMFNYVVFRAEGRADDEWNDAFFMSYKDLEDRDMFHKLGPKRLKVWEYLFRDMPQGRLDGKYIYRKAKATETLKHYHGALTDTFETFVARCEILKFDLCKDQLTSKDYEELAKSGDGFNPVDSEEDSSDSDFELGEDTCVEVPRGGMVQAHDDGTVHSHEGSIPVAAPSVASMVAPSETTALQDNGKCGGNEEDDIEIPGEASTLPPGDAIPPGYCADPNTIYFLEGKHTHTGEDQWGHDIIWHEGVLQPNIQDGEWKMAVKYTSGWKTFRRMSKDIWLKTTELAILHRVLVENPGQSEAAIKAKAEELFHVLRDNRQLEYSNKFYALRSSPSCGSINWKVDQTARTLEGSCSHDFMPSAEPASVAAQAGHRGDDGITVVGPQEVDMTSMPQISKKSISVASAQSSPAIEVSTTLPPDAGATYGSLLITNAAMQGKSEIESESDVGPSVAESQL
ncbi:hypothetical protein CBR_g26024 [Chara braunii]|uniref:Uncharacterized protein n=1 Tax=Chara braunii TaxID=69332 RepID=A0A388L714_CHABU|nr:hypothetical protein CBR_g26024 [Chara braunii]|eukprot:GBG78086.1 hypothetical protein CBR_g26024 [Chara braunii]